MPDSAKKARLRVAIDISVETKGWPAKRRLAALTKRAVEATIDEIAPAGERTELSVLFTGDEQIRLLNAQWRAKDKPTNVLSFPAFEPRIGGPVAPMLGDIVVARETVEREAALESKRFDDHLTHLVVHGCLHLLGYDHEVDDEAEVMEAAERRILARLAIADPYALSEDYTLR
ncbi:MAG: rRNA maturation RNase YbeY [Mesorhizobium sp.]